ncbi:MAG TPA: hypothetical protein VF487_05835 [Chitinophagaceae bacterium]
MEKPLPKKQFKRKVRQEFIVGGLVLLFVAAGVYVKGCFSKDSSTQTHQNTINTNSDSASSNTTNNKDVEIKGDQINAGRDANVDKRKVEVKGDAFFDSSKQINNYQGLRQRHIDLSLMKKILDSIPSKTIKIEIAAGGGKEGENLGKEISDYLEKRGYKKAKIISWSMTGNWDITEYHFDVADSTFRIDIHPQSNDQQIH